MKIACLAWGSLLWKTEPLALSSSWFPDGPVLPLEFCRVGDGGELATALCPGAPLQTAWWALLKTPLLDEAREQLRKREEIDSEHPEWIGSCSLSDQSCRWPEIEAWMQGRGLDAVIWTALLPRYAGVEGQAPDTAQAVDYLGSLAGHVKLHAEDYVRRMPRSFDTPARREIERRLGWTPLTQT